MNNNSWISFYKPRPQPKLRLFCFPHAGGGASFYRLWSDELPPGIDVCPVQLPGRENRVMDPPFNDVNLLLQTLTSALFPYLNKPFAFFGHSLGALISFELARHLRREHGRQPVHLLVSGYQAPPIENKLPPMSHLPDEEFVEQLRDLNSIPEAVLEHEELVELLLPALRADFAIYERYVYYQEEQLDCPISAFGGERDDLVFEDDLQSWRNHTKQSCTVRMFSGDHFFLHNDRGRVSLLEVISEVLMQHCNHG
ncbi:thioesterase [candidate division KSB1 bacterium]|nr:thioesterase [candidate division KSB1 bacterium]NIR71673.1 thioesterase [candidate division KSB1 bacterium]NIS26385.1 thioesterase [candidate division KSB1 bacterium]NIT73144.1 thioesterase [candidate division KSB1 bacterium]NIU27071.1 thioesterase [candidate division KSB1 bacterium]